MEINAEFKTHLLSIIVDSFSSVYNILSDIFFQPALFVKLESVKVRQCRQNVDIKVIIPKCCS